MLKTIQPIYRDWQTNEKLLGYAMLEERVEGGLTFILSDVDEKGEPIPETKQIVYSYDTWFVKFLLLTDLGKSIVHNPDFYKVKVRYIKHIGLLSAEDGTHNPYPKQRKKALSDNLNSY